MGQKIKLWLTTLPRTFIRVQLYFISFNSIQLLALWYAELAAVCVIVVLLDMLSGIACGFIINSEPGTHDWMLITVFW